VYAYLLKAAGMSAAGMFRPEDADHFRGDSQLPWPSFPRTGRSQLCSSVRAALPRARSVRRRTYAGGPQLPRHRGLGPWLSLV